MLFRPPDSVDVSGMPTQRAPDGQEVVPADLAATIYMDRCASCHGDEGEGVYAPAIAGSASATKYPDPAEQVRIVLDGKGQMRSFAGELTREQVEAVIAYVRALPDPRE
jgi:mono/diheme cytochrome c family protein